MATRKVNRQRRKSRALSDGRAPIVEAKPDRNLGGGWRLHRPPTGRAANVGRGA